MSKVNDFIYVPVYKYILYIILIKPIVTDFIIYIYLIVYYYVNYY